MNQKSTKQAIRIVKRDERERREQSQTATKKSSTPQQSAREMVATVTGWVAELQQRHRTETVRAIKNLFPETNAAS